MHIQAAHGYLHVATVHPSYLERPWRIVEQLKEQGADLWAARTLGKSGADVIEDEEAYEAAWQEETRKRRRHEHYVAIARESFDYAPSRQPGWRPERPASTTQDCTGDPIMSTRTRAYAKSIRPARFTVNPAVDRSGTVFTNFGAGASISATLPTPGPGLHGHWYEFISLAAQPLIIGTAAPDTLVVPDDLQADTVTLAQVGGGVRMMCLRNMTGAGGAYVWVASNISGTLATHVTLAT